MKSRSSPHCGPAILHSSSLTWKSPTHPHPKRLLLWTHMLCLITFSVELRARHISAPSNPFHQCHSRGFIAVCPCYQIAAPVFYPSQTPPTPPKRDFSSLSTSSNTRKNLSNPSLLLSIYTQMARVLIHLMRLLIIQQVGAFQRQYSFGRPVGPLPFTVNSSNNTAELQAPPEAIAFMLLRPPFPPALFATWIPNTS